MLTPRAKVRKGLRASTGQARRASSQAAAPCITLNCQRQASADDCAQ